MNRGHSQSSNATPVKSLTMSDGAKAARRASGEDAPAAGNGRAPFGTIKARMGATHFLMKTLPRVAAEMALHVLAYNMTRVMNIMGTKPLIAAIRV
jgi:hypothetical protein